jgi:uncharacterized protein (DUF1015 family)
MAEVVPFKGILYNVSKVVIEGVLAPPYDIITPEYKEVLYKRSPFNIVRIDYGKDIPGDNHENNRYTRARKYFQMWMYEDILIQSKKPAFYIYTMEYKVHGKRKQLTGFLGLMGLEELGSGSIYPHECTYSKAKRDRLELLRLCDANISPIFSLYKSTEGKVSALFSKIMQSKPYFEATDADGALHRLWKVDKKKDINVIKKELEGKPIFIADGHHRYETALEYQREMKSRRSLDKGKEPYDYVLMFFSNMFDEGLTILPTHRLVKEIPDDIDKMLSEYFEIETLNEDFDIAKKMSGLTNVFGFFRNDSKQWHLLHLKKDVLFEISPDIREIDVFVLHELVLKKILHVTDIDYEMDIQKALEKVREGQFEAVFFLNPTKVEDVEKAALSSVRMPPKSTYFYPKLLTGVVINSFSHSGVSG